MIRIITMEREYGAGGSAIALKLAEQLKWKLWDEALTAEIARLANCDQHSIARLEERVDPLFYRLMKVFMRGSHERSLPVNGLENLDADSMVVFMQRVIERAAVAGDCVIVGRGAPYLLELDEITRRVAEAEAEGATEVCLQGGIHPNFDGDYYVHVLGAVRAASERIHIHGFTALEVTEGARRSEVPLAEYLVRLKEAGLKTLPGTAAEILDDDIRALICPDKINTEQWLEAHRTAHSVGLRSNITIMFGSVEQPLHWARHIVRTRDLQRETGGFTEFVPLPFVHMATPIYLQRKARRGPTFRETLLMHSVARIAYHGDIDNIQVSWVKMGVEGSRQLLQAGANDLGGTLMDENISRAAGAKHGQRMGVEELEALVAPLGRPLVRRSTLYAMAGTASST